MKFHLPAPEAQKLVNSAKEVLDILEPMNKYEEKAVEKFKKVLKRCEKETNKRK